MDNIANAIAEINKQVTALGEDAATEEALRDRHEQCTTILKGGMLVLNALKVLLLSRPPSPRHY